MPEFTPTPQQAAIIEHNGSGFVSACPGAGKTRCIVERSRRVLAKPTGGRALAFMSFTNAAVSELRDRLLEGQVLPVPVFPHFVGTFDSFIWHYMVEPFGLDGITEPLRLIPDKGEIFVRPYAGAQELRLNCFDRVTNTIILDKAKEVGFNRNPKGYETVARNTRTRLLERGQLDFDEVREVANKNLANKDFSDRLARILSARFDEVIIDEAQDCNPEDLSIIDWLRKQAGVSTKIVCDPHQSIYSFRGGVAEELFKYKETFEPSEQLPLTGNFRSSTHICKAVHMLRAPSYRGDEDEALGNLKDCVLKVHVLSYGGQGVSAEIGPAFAKLAEDNGVDLQHCRLTAKTRKSGRKATGAYPDEIGNSLSLRLANAVMKFHHAENPKDQISAITAAHEIVLAISGVLKGRTYHQTITQEEIDPLSWRGYIVRVLSSLCFDVNAGHTRVEWVARARAAFGHLIPDGGGTIAQKLSNQTKLDDILGTTPTRGLSPRTIHEVKGKEYLGMCVVLTSAKAKGILDHLEKESDNSNAEDARELYVAASRAQKFLVFACPKSQAKRLANHVALSGAEVELISI